MAFTGSSFASGVAILLRGTHGSGVYLTDKYPIGKVEHPHSGPQNSSDQLVKQIPLMAAQQQMRFPIYWPQSTLRDYTLKHVNLYSGLNQEWADGPMLEFEFGLSPSSLAPKGTGEVWVREFKPKEDVLQLVKEGASVPIDTDDSGKAMAIYVDGQWEPRGRSAPEWVYGGRSELIYQVNGVVFWIVGDQRDGVGEKQLMSVAQGLALLRFGQHYRLMEAAFSVTQMSEDVPGPFSSDVIVLFPDNGTGGPYYVSVGSYPPPKKGSNVH